MLAIVREERQLSDLNERLKDAEPDLPVHYSLAKTLEETKDAKQRSHRQLTERCVFDHRVCIFLSLSLSSALTFFTDGTLSLSMFYVNDDSKRAKYCVRLKYFGNAFASFAWDKNVDDVSKHSRDRFYGEKWTPGNASVVATIRESLGEHCAGFDKEKHPVVYQSGRTDRNVSGAGQIVQIFRDPKDHLERRYVDEREEKEKCELIRRAINESTEVGKRGYLKAVECFRVNSEWHATFSATWRRYVYIVPKRTLNVEEVKEELRKVEGGEIDAEDLDMFTQYSEDEIDCDLLDRMLRKFEGKTIDFNAFARDTAKGKSTECTMLYARARRITIPKFQMNAETRTYGKRYRDRRFKDTSLLFDDPTFLSANAAKKEDDEEEPLECIAIELVADRFLRKMVRCIVSTACREAMLSNPNRTTDHQREEEAKEFNENVLLDLARNGDRTALAPPAPPYGLLFCGVGYGNESFENFVARD
jgi:tRNA pseudouridine(38-40) synthase